MYCRGGINNTLEIGARIKTDTGKALRLWGGGRREGSGNNIVTMIRVLLEGAEHLACLFGSRDS